MSTRIATNVLSLTAQRAIHRTQQSLDQAVNRLSTGLRINAAWDDPAGLAVTERFRGQISSMMEAERNANNNINLLATAEGALSSLNDILIRMRGLAVEAANGSLTDQDRTALDLEFQQLKSEITRIANSTNFAGVDLLDGSYTAVNPAGFKFHIGTYNVAGEDYYWVPLHSMRLNDLGITNENLLTTATAQAAIDPIDAAIESKDAERARLGAYVNRLQHTVQNLQIGQEKTTASLSDVRDADIAKEMSEFIRAQILMQSGIAMLSQANMLPNIVAGLIG